MCCNVFNTLFNVKEKNKDSVKLTLEIESPTVLFIDFCSYK